MLLGRTGVRDPFLEAEPCHILSVFISCPVFEHSAIVPIRFSVLRLNAHRYPNKLINFSIMRMTGVGGREILMMRSLAIGIFLY